MFEKHIYYKFCNFQKENLDFFRYLAKVFGSTPENLIKYVFLIL
jgi:hypothetical protein